MPPLPRSRFPPHFMMLLVSLAFVGIIGYQTLKDRKTTNDLFFENRRLKENLKACSSSLSILPPVHCFSICSACFHLFPKFFRNCKFHRRGYFARFPLVISFWVSRFTSCSFDITHIRYVGGFVALFPRRSGLVVYFCDQ
ncbi:hypothetical protein KP509_17G063700 [Ceratopteris richardii]|uniref:Uncharacterized protein n=1 Tax=Ceratopteris richardii TaxID=49495 RepID=A0A8T2SWT9_CERRI|nr:hypothetical protein KP509_17G063700 [Ceratopteris richardii]